MSEPLDIAWNVLKAVLGGLVAISVVVALHEWGHFVVARWCRVHVVRFGIGFGRAIWSYRSRNGTEYVIGWLPIGGYVKMLDAREIKDLAPGQHCFQHRPISLRMCIVWAGIVMNFLLAVVLFYLVFAIGFKVPQPVIARVAESSIAAQAGLKAGDQIVAVNHAAVHGWAKVAAEMVMRLGDAKPLLLEVKGVDGERRRCDLHLQHWQVRGLKPQLLPSLGIAAAQHGPVVPIQYSLLKAWLPAWSEVLFLIKFNAVVLTKLVLHQLPASLLGGPISIFSAASQAALHGVLTYMNFVAYFSIMLGFINCIPLPVMDGGQFVLLVIEAVRGKPLSDAVMGLVYRLSIIVLVLLLVMATLNDVQRVF